MCEKESIFFMREIVSSLVHACCVVQGRGAGVGNKAEGRLSGQ